MWGYLGFPKDSDVRDIEAHKYQLMATLNGAQIARLEKSDRDFDSQCETCNKTPEGPWSGREKFTTKL